ncbi:MAG TPA: 4-alpha-glucanotransferase, partial [Stellaceae bacterium]|nr:4-alpha-glucanotransferase [Stellaceae bacterium]
MSRLDELRRVAGLVGIATRHVDALGVVHEPGEETLERLIAACGLPAEPQKAAEALAEAEREAPFGLPPLAVVAAEEGAPVLALRLPDGVAALEWHLRREDGARIEGRSAGAELRLPEALPLGYHRLALAAGGTVSEIDLAVAPAACRLGEALEQGGCWGLTAQLYGLRGARDCGIGDFSDLAELCRDAGRLGAAVVGINPLHALFAAEPRHCSPYSPSSRLWLDYLYLDVTRVPGFAGEAMAPAPRGPLVDYAAVAALKRPLLETAFRRFRREDGPFAAEFRAFREAGGAALADFATFEALHEHFLAAGQGFAWHGW